MIGRSMLLKVATALLRMSRFLQVSDKEMTISLLTSALERSAEQRKVPPSCKLVLTIDVSQIRCLQVCDSVLDPTRSQPTCV